jgi:hypothetical protein
MLEKIKGNAVVTIPMPCSSSAQCRCLLSRRGSTVFIAEDGKGPYPDMA